MLRLFARAVIVMLLIGSGRVHGAVPALIVLRKAWNGRLGIGQLTMAALLKEATASSVLSNTSNTLASFVMCNTSFG